MPLRVEHIQSNWLKLNHARVYLHVHFRPVDCWLVWVCQMTRFVSSNCFQGSASQGEHGCVAVILDPLSQPPPNLNWNDMHFWKECSYSACSNQPRFISKVEPTYEMNSDSVYRRPEWNPSSWCTSLVDPNRWCAPEMSETCGVHFLWQSFRCLAHGIFPTTLSFPAPHLHASMPDDSWLVLCYSARFPCFPDALQSDRRCWL